MEPKNRLRLAPVLFALLWVASLSLHAATLTWTNVDGGIWSASTNWSPNAVPGPGDTAAITTPGTYTVTLDARIAAAGLLLGGASGQQTLEVNSQVLGLTGPSVVDANGVLVQSGGQVRSDTILTVKGLYNWGGGVFAGVQTITGSGTVVMASSSPELQGTVTNAGTIRWSGSTFYLEQGSTVYNLPGGTFLALADGQNINPYNGGLNQFINQGTFQKSGNADGIAVQVDFINSGTVQVQAGTLSFPIGFTSSGSFDVDSGAELNLRGGVFTLNAGHSFTGAGFYGVDNGNVLVVGDIAADNFQFRNGSLDGTNRVGGTMVWNSGYLRGIHTIAPGGTLRMEAGSPELQGILTNAGTIRWSGSTFYLEQGSTVYNLPGGTFLALADGQNINPYNGGLNQFINQGTFQKSGNADGIAVQVDFINSGTVQVQAGTLSFPIGFTSSGSFDVDSGAELNLRGGVFTLNAGHSFTGAGFYGVDNGNVLVVGDIAADNFQFRNGSLDGTNRVGGTVVWNSGYLRGIHTIAPGGTLRMEAGSPELQGILTNAGTIRWSGSTFYLEQGSTVYNLPGGTFLALADGQNINPYNGGLNQFFNQGTFQKSGNLDAVNVSVDFHNSGLVDIQQGLLRFPDGYVQTAGSTLLDGGALAASQPITIEGGSLGGVGTITGTVTNSSQVNPGIGRGQLTISGNYAQTASGALNIELAGVTPDAYDQLAVSGTVTLDGRLNTRLTNGFVPSIGGTFAFLTAGTLSGSFAQHSYPSNLVALQLNYAPTSAVIQVVNIFTNATRFPPALNPIADQLIAPGKTLRFRATAAELNIPPQPLGFSLGPGAPAGASIDAVTGDFSWSVPAGKSSGTVTVTVRVTEQGSPGMSSSQLVNIIVDGVGPRVVGMAPTNQIAGVVSHIDLTFQEVIDPASLAAATLVLSGPSGPISTSASLADSNVVRISFSSLPQGAYSLKIGPNIADLAGNFMDQNRNGINGEAMADVFAGQLTVGLADLVISSITVPAEALIGQPVALIWTVRNQGNVAAAGPWYEAIFLDSDSSGGNAQALAYLQFTNTLLAGQSLTRTQTVILPGNIFGQKYFAIQADLYDQVSEGVNETNNVTVAGTPTFIRAPDLLPTVLTGPSTAQLGQTVNVTWSVGNNGTGSAVANWNDAIYLTPGANSLVGGMVLAVQTITNSAPMSAGAIYTRTQAVTLPLSSALQPGQFFLTVSADDGNAQPESDEADNLISRPLALTLPPLPDLVVRDIVAPANAVPGQQVPLQWTVTNQGTFQASGSWSETVSFSNSPPLATFAFTNTIPVAGSVTRTQMVTIPANDAAGSLYFTVQVNSNQEVNESNESNNVSVAAQPIRVPATLTLALPQDSILENAANPLIEGVVTRNGDRTGPLVVNVASSDTTLLTVPSSVTISSGQVSAPFDVAVQHDNRVRGNQSITITATASGFTNATNAITVIDVDLPRLTLALGATNVVEGDTVNVTVTRDVVAANPVVVALASSDLLHLLVPSNVVIAASQASTSFQAVAVQNTLIEGTRSYTATASAAGYLPASAAIAILDDDIPQLTVHLAAHEVSEGAGAQATTGTVTRDPVGPRDLVITLESQNVNAALVPGSVTIPAGSPSATFPVAAVNNKIVDGTKTARIQAYITDPITGARLRAGTPDTLSVLDDDGPTLQITLNRTLVAQSHNPAAAGTVTRNAGLNTALVVTLSSTDTNAIILPPSVTLPAGSNSVSFPIISSSSGVTGGDQPVTIMASATNYVRGSATIVVTDRNLPDLVVSLLNVPTNGVTASPVNLTFRVTNQGLAVSTNPIVQRVFLSSDPVIGDDVLVNETTFADALPPDARFEQTVQVRLPNTTGDYWLVVTTDSRDNVAESREDNNAALSALPIHVDKSYSATVQSDVTVALAGTPIPLHGQAILTANHQPAPFSLVNLHIAVRGTERVISAVTDQNGNYSVVFTPLPGEAGDYLVGADHPGVSSTPPQISFTLLGLRVTPPPGVVKLTVGNSFSSLAAVDNLSDIAASNLTAAVIDKPANVQVTLSLTNDSLAGLGETFLGFTLTPLDLSISQGTVLIRLSNPSGLTADLRLPVTVGTLQPHLQSNPASLVVGMKRGSQTTVSFKIFNDGGAPSGNLTILPPAVSWLKVSTGGQLPSLAPGQTNSVTLVLTPPADLALGDHQGTIALNGAGAGLSLPFTFRALSSLSGELRISSVDEYTYYAQGSPPVTNAAVTITDQLSGTVVQTNVMDAKGELVITNLTEAYYRIDASADGHGNFSSTILVQAGLTNEVLAFLPRETVKYIWTVVPTEIEDRTKFVVEAVFETVVPVPVVTVDPILVDLADFQGSETQINYTISNHGLVAAENTRIVFEDNPNWVVTALITNIGVLAAQSSLTIPVTFQRIGQGTGAVHKLDGGGGGCDLRGAALYDLICGPVTHGNGVPFILKNAASGCGGGGAGFTGFTDSGLFSGGGGGSAVDNGGGPSTYVGPSEVRAVGGPCNPCAVAVVNTITSVIMGDDAGNCVGNLVGCLGGLKTPGYDATVSCVKGLVTCVKAIGEAAGGGANAFFNTLNILQNAKDAADKCGVGGSSLSKHPLDLGPQSVGNPELARLGQALDGLQTEVDMLGFFFGDTAWLSDSPAFTSSWLALFLPVTETNSPEGVKISVSEQASLMAGPLPPSVTPAIAQQFIARWNQTMDNWAAGKFNSTDVPAGQATNFLAYDFLQGKLSAFTNALAAAQAQGYSSLSAAVEDARQEAVRSLGANSGGDCASVKLRIEQEAVITRDAFNATLEIQNSTGDLLENVSVELVVRNQNGVDTTGLFGIRPPALTGLTAVDGTGVIGPNSSGKATWIIIPTSEAAPDGPTMMAVSGTLKYQQGGVQITVPLAPASINVLPNASLKVKYFQQRDVLGDDPFTPQIEPSVPFSLGILIQNAGKGAARNVHITSAQPQIVDNQKGLLIDFSMIATEVNGQNLSPSLTADFGDIGPGDVAVGRWLLLSSLQGQFVDYQATFEHEDSLGDRRLSLVDSVEIHELIHVVHADRVFEDGKPNFLANDVPDLQNLPDTLYLSDGSIQPVNAVAQGNIDAPPTVDHLQVQLTATLPAGWVYLRIPDPGNANFTLTEVRRADGSVVPLNFNVWTTDRTFIGHGQRPIYENTLHLLDYNSSGSYTLIYSAPPVTDTTPPISAVQALPTHSPSQVQVQWGGTDNASGSGIHFFDIYVSVNGGPFAPWLQKTTLSGALYAASQNDRLAFFSVATDNAGNRETPHTTPDAQTTADLINHPPNIQVPSQVTINAGDTLVLTNSVTDPDAGQGFTFGLLPGSPAGAVIDPASGTVTWATSPASIGSTNGLGIVVTDSGVPALSATGLVTVIVRAVNHPPLIATIPDMHVAEGSLLTFTASAADPDLPPNHITFQLGPGAPAGAAITKTGVFTWTPLPLQGPSTNVLSIIATDDGTPPLSSTRTVTIVVFNVLGDFKITFGSTNLLAGQTSSIPIRVSSGDLASLGFTLNLVGSGLENLSLVPVAPEIAGASVLAAGPGAFRIQFSTLPGQVLQGIDRDVAVLNFDALPGVDSSIAALRLSGFDGIRSTGAALTNGSGVDGQIIVIGTRPVLQAVLVPGPALVLYGNPNRTYQLQSATTIVAPIHWQPRFNLTLTNTAQMLQLTNLPGPMGYFRALQP